jgi:hypothetical protein
VLSGRVLWVRLNTRPEESYGVWGFRCVRSGSRVRVATTRKYFEAPQNINTNKLRTFAPACFSIFTVTL